MYRLNKDRGFTLVEIMISMAIVGIISLSLIAVFETGIRAWKHNYNALTTLQSLQTIMDLIIDGDYTIGDRRFPGLRNAVVITYAHDSEINFVPLFVERRNFVDVAGVEDTFALYYNWQAGSPLPLVCEPYLDANNNGYYDPGEMHLNMDPATGAWTGPVTTNNWDGMLSIRLSTDPGIISRVEYDNTAQTIKFDQPPNSGGAANYIVEMQYVPEANDDLPANPSQTIVRIKHINRTTNDAHQATPVVNPNTIRLIYMEGCDPACACNCAGEEFLKILPISPDIRINNITFQYYDKNGNQLGPGLLSAAQCENIRSVRVSIRGAFRGSRAYTIQSGTYMPATAKFYSP